MPMTPDEFRRALLTEQYSHPVPQWHPRVDDLIAGAERVRLLEQQQQEQAA